jgi:hypothetical protein
MAVASDQLPAYEQIIISGAVWGLLAAAAGAIIAGWLSRRLKVSEFRQAWIDGLRADIVAYLGAVRKWYRKWEELRDPDISSSTRASRDAGDLAPIANEALMLLWRIQLRINPRSNRYKSQDDAFLASLDDVFNPGKLDPTDLEGSWQQLAKTAVENGRELLKREWEVTKGKCG